MKVLVTGGAGFIGSHIVDLLIENRYEVRILDNLEEQVHSRKKPEYLNQDAEFIKGDVRRKEDWKRALEGIDAVSHQAAMVGIGQSMYQPVRYLKTNIIGTANMYEVIDEMNLDLEKIVVASSMSTYGEGAYKCEEHGEVYPLLRDKKQLEKGEWELKCPKCSSSLKPIPTHEEKPQQNLSTYALSKYDQERMALNYGFALNIPTVTLRYFNVYGPRQSLNNPYTGVAAIFSSRIKNNRPPKIYEDGKQTRDFIYVEDVARANLKALESHVTGCFNIGTGKPTSIINLAETLIDLYNVNLTPEITGEFRPGDIRHCFADTNKMKNDLGFKPEISLKEGLKKLSDWGKEEEATDKFEEAEEELNKFIKK